MRFMISNSEMADYGTTHIDLYFKTTPTFQGGVKKKKKKFLYAHVAHTECNMIFTPPHGTESGKSQNTV